MCPGVSPGGGRFGVGLAKTSRVAQEEKAMEKKEGVLLAACVSEILEVPLRLWHPSSQELWKLGSGAVLCHPHENSVKLGADTRLLGRSLRSPRDILTAKPWRVAAGPAVLQAGRPLRPFLSGDFSWAATAAELEWGENAACMELLGDRTRSAGYERPWDPAANAWFGMTHSLAVPCGA